MRIPLSGFLFGLPLLTKELIEQSARKRTYVIRVLYAVLLFLTAFLMFYDELANITNVWSALGRGRMLFQDLLALQFTGVYLFMPAITCGVISQEKERHSLMLLFLTRLGPWTILLEKLLGRVVPMLCFLLLSLPLLAFAYSLGGISPGALWGGVWMLVATILQMGALALACSAFFRTTVGAFVFSYLIGGCLLLGPGIVILLASVVLTGSEAQVWNWPSLQWLQQIGVIDFPQQILFPFFGAMSAIQDSPFRPSAGFWMVALRSLPVLFSALVFLLLARCFIVTRAFVTPFNPLLALFKALDRILARLNDNRVTRGVVLMRDRNVLPETNPIAWRETHKRSLGQPRYLVRIFLVIQIPLLVVLLFSGAMGREFILPGPSIMYFLLWPVAVLFVAVSAACLVSAERTHQTLDVLCTLPLSGRDIVLQKFRGVRRLMLMLMVPLVTIIAFETWWRSQFTTTASWRAQPPQPVLYALASILAVVIYLPLVAWLSYLIGLVTRTQGRAIIGALGAIVGWCLLPFVFVVLPLTIMLRGTRFENTLWAFTTMTSPATMIPLTQFNDLDEFAHKPWLAVAVNFGFYGFCWFGFRQACLLSADRLLGRSYGNLLRETTPQPQTVSVEPAFAPAAESSAAFSAQGET